MLGSFVDFIARKHGNGIARNKRSINKHIPTWNQARVSALPVVIEDVYNYEIPPIVPTDTQTETPPRFRIVKNDRKRFDVIDSVGDYVYETHKTYDLAKKAVTILNRNASRIQPQNE